MNARCSASWGDRSDIHAKIGGAVASERKQAKSFVQLGHEQGEVGLQEKYFAPRGTFHTDIMIDGMRPMAA